MEGAATLRNHCSVVIQAHLELRETGCSAPQWERGCQVLCILTMASAVAEEVGHMHATGLPAYGWRRLPKGGWSKRGRSLAREAGAITARREMRRWARDWHMGPYEQ